MQGWRRREERHGVYWARVRQQTNTPKGSFSSDPTAGSRDQLSPKAGAATSAGAARVGSCCLLSTYCVLGSLLDNGLAHQQGHSRGG